MTLLTCSARAANMSSVSVIGVTVSVPRSSTIWRMRSASGVPPGSRVASREIPWRRSRAAT